MCASSKTKLIGRGLQMFPWPLNEYHLLKMMGFDGIPLLDYKVAPLQIAKTSQKGRGYSAMNRNLT